MGQVCTHLKQTEPSKVSLHSLPWKFCVGVDSSVRLVAHQPQICREFRINRTAPRTPGSLVHVQLRSFLSFLNDMPCVSASGSVGGAGRGGRRREAATAQRPAEGPCVRPSSNFLFAHADGEPLLTVLYNGNHSAPA